MLDIKRFFCKNYLVKKLVNFLLIISLLSPPLFSTDTKTLVQKNLKFGAALSQKGLWKEAIYRWKRVIELDPTNWKAYNNLAVAYEREGLLNEAINLYQIALQYSNNNPYVRRNYSSCLSIIEGSKEKK